MGKTNRLLDVLYNDSLVESEVRRINFKDAPDLSVSGSNQDVTVNIPLTQRASIVLTHNGTIGNQWIGYSELIPGDMTSIVIPWNCYLADVTFAFDAVSVDGTMEFYKNGTTVTERFRQWNFTNVNNYQILTNANDSLNAGDVLRIKWVDSGSNPADAALVLFFKLR